MSQIVKVYARTQAMKVRKEDPILKEVVFPSNFNEVKAGVGPWKNLRELFEDAVAHRRVIIQAKMRQALENGSDESEEDESGLAFEE